MTNTSESAESGRRNSPALEVLVGLGQRLHAAVVAEAAERIHRDETNLRVPVVQRGYHSIAYPLVDGHVAHSPRVEPGDDPDRRAAHIHLLGSEGRYELWDRRRQQVAA